MSTKTKSEGAYPDAHPTAPGGMSQANLRLELAETHGVKMEESRALSWPDLIQRVCDERLAREAEDTPDWEKSAVAVLAAEDKPTPMSGEEYTPANLDVDAMFEDIHDPDEEPSADEVLAEFDDLLDDDSDEFEGYKAPPVQYHKDGSEHDQTECLHNGCGGVFDGDDSDEAIMGRNIREITAANAALTEDDEYADDNVRNMVAHASDTVIVEMDADVFDPESLFAEMQAGFAETQAANPPLFLGIPGIKDYVFAGHAGAGPSASERWMHCTMSLSLSRVFLETLSPNQQAQYAGANTAARQGTTAHAVGEAKANHMLGRISDEELESTLLELAVEKDEGEAYDDEMDEYVNEYVDLIKSYADERGVENMRIETRVEAAIPLDALHEGEVYIIRGSADVIGMPTPEDPTMIVGDLKYGEGIHVDAEENSQAMIYALGALEELVDDEGNLTCDIESITLIIAQPRLGGIKTWDISLDDLLDWRDEVLSPALTKALYGENEGATFNPSDSACQFCPARGTCPALTQQRVDAAAEAFDAIIESEHTGEDIEPTGMSNEQLGAMLSQISGLIDLHKSLKAEAQMRLHRGTPVPGYTLVNYTPPRKWKEGAADSIRTSAIAGLTKEDRRKLFKEAPLLTPRQATVILGEKASWIADLYDTPDKKPVVAPEGDRRSKWEGRPPEAMFDDESTPADVVRAAEEMFPDEDAQ